MPDSDAMRSRRHRLHARGDHSLCRHRGALSVSRVPVGVGWPPVRAEERQQIAYRRFARGERRELEPGCRTGDHAQCDLDEWHGVCSECGKTVRLSRSSAPPERRRCRDCQRAHPRTTPGYGKQRVGPPRVCVLCGETYVPMRHARPDQRWCSKSCAQAWRGGARPPYERPVLTGMPYKLAQLRVKARERRMRHAETWDGITDEEILERDRWRCGICRKRIGKSFKYPHPRSKSIDHIIPLSEDGDDTAANKRAAHLGCNLSRGSRGGNEQAALFG